jgi:sarcosine oxidase subunit beta
MILAREEDRPAIEHVVRLQQSLGVEAALIRLPEIRDLSPHADLRGVVAGCFERRSGYADPRATVYALCHRARELGAEIQQLTEVRDIRRAGDRVMTVATSRGEISTPVIINCAGPWAGRIGRMVGLDYSLRFSRELDVKVQVPAGHGAFPVSADPANGTCFRPQTGGFAIAGRAFPKELEPCDPDTYNDRATTDEVETIADRLKRRMPRAGDGLPVAGWAGVYSITDDWHPIVGDMPQIRGYYHFMGGSGHGFKISPPIGESLAAIIAGCKPPIDISPLHYSRFASGNTFRSAWGPGNRA